MAKKMLNPNTTLWAVDAADVTNIKDITATELNAALNFSCAVVRGYTLNPTDSDTDDSASICDSGNVENRLYDNYEGEFTMFRDADVLDNLSIFNQAFAYFKEPDRRHYIVRRVGKRNTAAAVPGDELEAFLFANDRIRSVDGGDDGPVQFTVPELQQGEYTGYFYLEGVNPGTVTITNAAPPAAEATDTVTLTGSGFTGATSVTIGGEAATSVTVVSDNSLTFVVPAGTAGSAPIVVTTPNGTSAPYAYTRG